MPNHLCSLLGFLETTGEPQAFSLNQISGQWEWALEVNRQKKEGK